MLLIFGGLPGTGKTTIARMLANRISGVHLRIDSIEQALRDEGAGAADLGPAGYVVAYAVAADNLAIGRTVIADSVNPIEVTRRAWRDVAERAGCPFVEIEVRCADEVEHRRRVESRTTDVPGLLLPVWADVVARRYEPWITPTIVVDTATASPRQSVDRIAATLG